MICPLQKGFIFLESPGNLVKRHRINDIMKYVNIYLIQCAKQTTVFVDSSLFPKFAGSCLSVVAWEFRPAEMLAKSEILRLG